MRERRVKYIFACSSLLLLTLLLFKIAKLPGGMILPGYVMGGMFLAIILIVCATLAGITTSIVKKYSFLTLFSIISTVAFLVFHYYLYSPTLKIVIPKGYSGEVRLVRSTVRENVLTIDSNGIGYINGWTFEKTYTEPVVVDVEGESINNKIKGFNQSTFWSKGKAVSTEFTGTIDYLSFEIISQEKFRSTYENSDFTKFVDKSKLPLTELP